MAAARYRGAYRTLILRAKYRDDVAAIRFLAAAMLHRARASLAGTETAPETSDTVVCGVPLHPWKRFIRGHDATDALAKIVAKGLSLPHRRLLWKLRWTRAQSRLSRSERRRNLAGSFSIPPWVRGLRGRSVILIDDVYTTGTTAARCANALLAEGIRDVVVLVAARS
jgi:predicted amidophosphoribosyltransferase